MSNPKLERLIPHEDVDNAQFKKQPCKEAPYCSTEINFEPHIVENQILKGCKNVFAGAVK